MRRDSRTDAGADAGADERALRGCFWSSSGDACGDCDQPAATVDWCSFSRSNCESCSNAEWCGESDLAPHAPAPSVRPTPQPSPRPSAPQPTDAQTVDGRIILPDGVSCGWGTWHLPQSCETCSGYIDGRNGENCVYGVGTNGRWHCKNENSGDILELDNSCFETPGRRRSRRQARRANQICVSAPDDSPVHRDTGRSRRRAFVKPTTNSVMTDTNIRTAVPIG